MKKKFFIFIIIVFLTIYLGRSFFNTLNNSVETIAAEPADMTISFKGIGYIIKNEMIINAPFDGKINKLLNSGIRVYKGASLAKIYTQNFDLEKLKQLKEVNGELEKQDYNLPFYKDIQKLDNMIKNEENNYKKAVGNKDASAENIRKRIDDLKNKKEVILSKSPLELRKIEDLKEQKKILEDYIDENSNIINAPQAGIISFYFNGYENILNGSNMYNLSLNELDKINNSCNQIETEIKKDKPIVKIIDNFDWYLAIPFTKDKINLFKEDENIKILIDNYPYELRGKIVKTYKDDDNNYICIVRMSDSYEDFYKICKVDLEVIFNNYSGIKVPLSSIVEKDGEKGIFIIKYGNNAVFYKINIKAKDNNYAIIESADPNTPIRFYDEIAVNGDKYLKK
ncbi:MAG: HlyD family efflux transporter periplasmic adaptor subunit [Minisyncoccia bacterium]